jgi:hypothetical protein
MSCPSTVFFWVAANSDNPVGIALSVLLVFAPVLMPALMAASAPIPSSSPNSDPRKRRRGIDQRSSIVASQAWAPLSSIVTANIAGSIDLIDQPSTKAARSSARDTRRGPQSPGWRSLKHIR